MVYLTIMTRIWDFSQIAAVTPRVSQSQSVDPLCTSFSSSKSQSFRIISSTRVHTLT